MPQRSTGRSTTTGSRTGNRNTRSTATRQTANVSPDEELITETPAPEVETPSEPEPEKKVMGGMIERKWSGLPNWLCPRCGRDTFDKKEADSHTCNGREIRPYKGDDK